jgi:hypothetical protein
MRLMLTLLATTAMVQTAAAQSAASRVAAKMGWHGSLDAARTEARKTGKPLMVVIRCDP